MTLRSRTGLLLICLVIAGACGALAAWQWGRLVARRATNAAASAQRSLDPVRLPAPGDVVDRRVRVSGSYDHLSTLVLRGRLEREVPGVHLVTPLLPEGSDTAVLVLRGFSPAPDAVHYDTATLNRPRQADVEGVAYAVPDDPRGGTPLEYAGTESWGRLDLVAIRARLPYPVAGVYVHAVSERGTETAARPYPRPVGLRPFDDGPHLSYTLQWIGIGLVALGFGVAQWRRGSTASAGCAGSAGSPLSSAPAAERDQPIR